MSAADPRATHVAAELSHSSPLITCRFDPKGRYVFAAAEDQTVQRWDLASHAKVSYAGPHESWVRGVAFADDGETLITGGYDGRLVWWPVTAEKPEPIRTVDAHAGWVRWIAASPDGTLLATTGNDHLVKLWNAADGSLVRTFVGHESHVYSALYHPSGRFILSGDFMGGIRQWDVAAGSQTFHYDAAELHSFKDDEALNCGGVRSLALSPDGTQLAASGLYKAGSPQAGVHEPLVIVFNWQTAKKSASHVLEGIRGVVWRALYHPLGFLIAACGGTSGGYLAFWNTGEEKEFHQLKLPNTARDLDLHPDGLRLATAHHDRHLRISLMQPKVGQC